MKLNFYIFSIIVMLFMSGGCSNSDEPSIDNPEESTRGEVNRNVYFYDGVIALDNHESGNPVYLIQRLMMYPYEYGNIIPIPLLDKYVTSSVIIQLGENSLIEENSVLFNVNGEERIESLPEAGEKVYTENLSILRLSKDDIEVRMKEFDWWNPVKILTIPKPRLVFDQAKDRYEVFETPSDYNLPDTIPLTLVCDTFLDHYRPIRQPVMTVY